MYAKKGQRQQGRVRQQGALLSARKIVMTKPNQEREKKGGVYGEVVGSDKSFAPRQTGMHAEKGDIQLCMLPSSAVASRCASGY